MVFVLTEEEGEETSPSNQIHQALSIQFCFMSGATWVMFRCDSCSRFSGARKGQKSMVCGHCGSNERLKVIREFNDPRKMAEAVSLENTPPEIRKELEKAMSQNRNKMVFNPSKPVNPIELIKESSDDEGVIDMEQLIQKSSSFGFEKSTVIEWIEQSEIEGMILRMSSGKYRLL